MLYGSSKKPAIRLDGKKRLSDIYSFETGRKIAYVKKLIMVELSDYKSEKVPHLSKSHTLFRATLLTVLSFGIWVDESLLPERHCDLVVIPR